MLPFFEGFEFYLRLDSDSVCDKPLPDYFSMLQVGGLHLLEWASNNSGVASKLVQALLLQAHKIYLVFHSQKHQGFNTSDRALFHFVYF